jgi:hypothetical protein
LHFKASGAGVSGMARNAQFRRIETARLSRIIGKWLTAYQHVELADHYCLREQNQTLRTYRVTYVIGKKNPFGIDPILEDLVYDFIRFGLKIGRNFPLKGIDITGVVCRIMPLLQLEKENERERSLTRVILVPKDGVHMIQTTGKIVEMN